MTNSRNALDLALASVARVVLPTFVGNNQSGLKQVTEPIGELEHDQLLVTHDEDRFLPDVRRVIERIYAVLRAAIK